MTTGIALAGGGARGDFEVGALRYLYDQGFRPDLLSSTSVGSINALKLAEGEDPNNPTRGLSGLEQLWLGMRENKDMWTHEPWYAELPKTEVVRWFKKSAEEQWAWGLAIPAGLFVGPVGWAMSIGLIIKTANDVSEFGSLIERAAASKSIANLNPIRAKIGRENLDLGRIRNSGIRMRVSVVSLDSGDLRYVTEQGVLLDRSRSKVVQEVPGMSSPECQPIYEEWVAIGVQIERLELMSPAEEGFIPPAHLTEALEDAERRFNECAGDRPSQMVPMAVDLVEAVMASASIPFFFPPVPLGGELYCDGGVREVLPIEAALHAPAVAGQPQLKTDVVFAIAASAPGVPPAERFSLTGSSEPIHFRDAGLMDIVSRVSSNLFIDEVAVNETDPPRGWDSRVVIIEPEAPDIHDIMTIDPGLIRIRMAYGYMRADDVLRAKGWDGRRLKSLVPGRRNYRARARGLSQKRLTDAILRTRHAIWQLENFVLNPETPLDIDFRGFLPQILAMKAELAQLIARRREAGGALPKDADSWATDWEAHPWQPRFPFNRLPPPPPPDRTLVVTIDPPAVPLGLATTVTITVRRASDNAPVEGATVDLVNFSADGRQRVDLAFVSDAAGIVSSTLTLYRQMEFDPETRIDFPGEYPSGTVSAGGFETTLLPLAF